MLAHDSSDRVGVGTALPAPDDGAGIVDDADGGRLERNVEADIMALLIHAFLRGGVDTAELTGLLGEQPSPAITPCPVAYDQVRGARGRGQGTETLAEREARQAHVPGAHGNGWSRKCCACRLRLAVLRAGGWQMMHTGDQ